MKRLFFLLLLLCNLGVSFLYLHERYPAVAEATASVPELDGRVLELRGWLEHQHIPLQWVLAADVGAILAVLACGLLIRWLMRPKRRRKKRPSDFSRLLKKILLGLALLILAFVAFWLWLYLQPDDTVALGSLRIARGTPEQLVDTSLNVVLLVMAGHLVLPLLLGIFSRKPQPAPEAVVRDAPAEQAHEDAAREAAAEQGATPDDQNVPVSEPEV